MQRIFSMTVAAALLTIGFISTAAAEEVTVGILKITVAAPVLIAQAKGYFAAEGLVVKPAFFDSANAIAIATASGAVDFGTGGNSATLYNLAGQGALRIVAGAAHEAPGFHGQLVVASNRAYAAGLTSIKKLGDHSVSVGQFGSPAHYSLSLIAEKVGLDLKTLRLTQMRGIAESVSAITGGQIDAAVLVGVPILPVINRDAAKLLGWISDEVTWQVGSVWTNTKTANNRRDMVERFLRALRRGSQDYHNAFIGPDERRRDGPTASGVLGIMAEGLGLPGEQLRASISYLDAEGRLDVRDVQRQIAWYQRQGFVKPGGDGNTIIDIRYVVPLPEK